MFELNLHIWVQEPSLHVLPCYGQSQLPSVFYVLYKRNEYLRLDQCIYGVASVDFPHDSEHRKRLPVSEHRKKWNLATNCLIWAHVHHTFLVGFDFVWIALLMLRQFCFEPNKPRIEIDEIKGESIQLNIWIGFVYTPWNINTGGVVESLDRSSYELYANCNGSTGASSFVELSSFCLGPFFEA